MQIKIYDLKENGLDFKSDFNRFERVRKVVDQRHSSFYWKIDLVTDCTGRLFLCTRYADFSSNVARMGIDEIQGFFRKTEDD